MAKEAVKTFDKSHPLYAKFIEMEREHNLATYAVVPEIKMLIDLHAQAKAAAEKYESERQRLSFAVDANDGAAELLPLHLFNAGVTVKGNVTSKRANAAEMGARWAAITEKLNGNPKPIPAALNKQIMAAKSTAELPPAAERHKAGVYTLNEIAELSGYEKGIITHLMTHKDYDKHFENVRQGTKRGVLSPVWHFKNNE